MKNRFKEHLTINIRKLGFSMVSTKLPPGFNRLCAFAITLVVLSIPQSTLSAQELDRHEIYDLRVGVERHYASCAGLTGACPTGGSGLPATERVIEHTDVNGNVYAVVTLTTWVWERESNDVIIHAIDTTLYRMEGSVLLEYMGGADIPVFDFGFSKGDSIMNIIGHYIVEQDDVRSLYGVDQDGVASVILIDTLLQFSDGISRNVLWGDDTLRIGENVYPPPTVLEFDFSHPVWDKIPIPQYNFHQPFYYISGIGVILTPYNHRKRMMCGFKTPDGDHFGCFAPRHVSVIDEPVDVPTERMLLQNYPNPFNPTTVIGYQLPQAEMVHLAVYDILGREVALLVDSHVSAGTHQVNFDGSNLSSGIYLYRLQAGNQVLTGKMMLMK